MGNNLNGYFPKEDIQMVSKTWKDAQCHSSLLQLLSRFSRVRLCATP